MNQTRHAGICWPLRLASIAIVLCLVLEGCATLMYDQLLDNGKYVEDTERKELFVDRNENVIVHLPFPSEQYAFISSDTMKTSVNNIVSKRRIHRREISITRRDIENHRLDWVPVPFNETSLIERSSPLSYEVKGRKYDVRFYTGWPVEKLRWWTYPARILYIPTIALDIALLPINIMLLLMSDGGIFNG